MGHTVTIILRPQLAVGDQIEYQGMVPEMSYSDLEIQEGGSATAEWIEMIRTTGESEKANITQSLLRYWGIGVL